MSIKYKNSKLSDGTKVKITEELFNNLKEWESQGYEIDEKYLDELKKQDDTWLNSYRAYYRRTYSLDAEAEKENPNQSYLLDPRQDVEKIIEQGESENIIHGILNECTEIQRRRFIKYYYLEFTLEMIAKQEGSSFQTVHKSIKKVEKKIISLKKFI